MHVGRSCVVSPLETLVVSSAGFFVDLCGTFACTVVKDAPGKVVGMVGLVELSLAYYRQWDHVGL